jgi:uncharacterized protein YceK
MKLSLFLLVILLAAGCSDDQLVAITDGRVYSQLTVRYDKNTNKTTATAAFWKESQSGARLVFNGNATILFQGLAMEYRSDYTYFKDMENAQTPATFKIIDVNKKEFTNTTTINAIDFPFGLVLDTIDTSKPLTIAWNGTALENLEIVTLRIGTGSVRAVQDTMGKTSITFTTSLFSQIASLKNTATTITIERSKSPVLTDDLGGGGTITSQFIALSKNVYLK